MAPPRTFSLDLLKELVRDHPTWTNRQYAEALTADNREHGRQATVSPHLVSATISAKREEWEEGGLLAPRKRRTSQLVAALTANTGVTIPDMMQDQIELRRLRQLDRIDAGLPVGGHDGEADRALAFESMLRRERKVVDLYPDGAVFLRAAAPHELTDHNELISIVASYRPPAMGKRHAG